MIVWARTADRSGNIKDNARPLLIIHPEPVSSDAFLFCLCISTRPNTDPKDPAIEMPWDIETGNTTGLYQFCRVVLLWSVMIDQASVTNVSGVVGPAFLAHILNQRAFAKNFPPT